MTLAFSMCAYPNTTRCPLDGQRLGQILNARPCSTSVCHTRKAIVHLSGDEDNGAAVNTHVRGVRLARAEKRTGQVCFDHGVPPLGADCFSRGWKLTACRTDKRVEATKLPQSKLCDAVPVSNVTVNGLTFELGEF